MYPQGRTASLPISRHSLVTSTKRFASSLTFPIQNILDASAKCLCTMVVQSTFIISPSFNTTFSLGIP